MTKSNKVTLNASFPCGWSNTQEQTRQLRGHPFVDILIISIIT